MAAHVGFDGRTFGAPDIVEYVSHQTPFQQYCMNAAHLMAAADSWWWTTFLCKASK